MKNLKENKLCTRVLSMAFVEQHASFMVVCAISVHTLSVTSKKKKLCTRVLSMTFVEQHASLMVVCATSVHTLSDTSKPKQDTAPHVGAMALNQSD